MSGFGMNPNLVLPFEHSLGVSSVAVCLLAVPVDSASVAPNPCLIR